jgi:hypothetical protein
MPSVSYTPVTVNLRVSVDASANVAILDTAADSRSDAVICNLPLPASTLFTDSSNGVFEFWEGSDREAVLGIVANAGINGSQVTQIAETRGLASGLHTCLTGPLNAAAAPIYSGYPSAYQSPASIGELALGYAAHQLFGHVAATAAITNDMTIVSYINDFSPVGAQLGKKLKDAILALGQADATGIVNVVLGQDAARARDEDNNLYAPDSRRALRFVEGDKIFVAVKMTGWASAREGDANVQVYTGNAFSDQTFYFRITLA